MTLETRTTIEASDIARIEFECPVYHARTTRELSEQNFVPTRCKGGMCSHVFIAENSAEMAYLQGALDLLGRYSKTDRQSFIMRLELKPLAS
jgi:hypothetical protein